MLEPTSLEITETCQRALHAFRIYRRTTNEERAQFLEAIAQEIDDRAESIEAVAHEESHLPAARLTGERGRTTGQLRLFARTVRAGGYHGIRLEEALPDRKPLPRPDLRRTLLPIGPVAVFGASNFPLAFSVAGGDTASALAAGCPVVVKAHPAHPRTCDLVAEAIVAAAKKTGMPEGVFGMVRGGAEVGQALVMEPAIAAVGFTGSFTAGTALWRAAHSRAVPIPVFAEMGSVNPVFVLPGALAETDRWAQAYADALTLGVGQFCTNPGLLIGVGKAFEAFVESVATKLDVVPEGMMLTPAIAGSYAKGVESFRQHQRVREATQPRPGSTPALFVTDAGSVQRDPALLEEVFGPAGLAIVCDTDQDLLDLARSLRGQLTATVLMAEGDEAVAKDLIEDLEQVAGRLIVNGMPTGVEVGEAMQHGGPWPATTDTRFTSVGTAAIERWLRPVCYQNMPTDLLPPALQ